MRDIPNVCRGGGVESGGRLSLPNLVFVPQCCHYLSVNAAPQKCEGQPAADGRSRTGCTFSQSAVVDPPGAASCSVMHRHATLQAHGKPNYTVLQHLDTRNTDCDRQTDNIYACVCLQCYFRQVSACDWSPLDH
jgi:hypothetical protein